MSSLDTWCIFSTCNLTHLPLPRKAAVGRQTMPGMLVRLQPPDRVPGGRSLWVYLVPLVPEELSTWAELPPILSWRGEKTGKGFLLLPHQRTGNPSASKLWPGEVETTVPSTALGMLPLRYPNTWDSAPVSKQRKRSFLMGPSSQGDELQVEPSVQK